ASEPAARPRAARLNVGEIEFAVARVRNALGDLGGAGPAGLHQPAIAETCRLLLSHHRRGPRPRPDETHVSSEDVPELRKLVEIPGFEHAAAHPGQVARVPLELLHVSALPNALEYALPDGPELQQVELAPA